MVLISIVIHIFWKAMRVWTPSPPGRKAKKDKPYIAAEGQLAEKYNILQC
jgi:hypothetical protein